MKTTVISKAFYEKYWDSYIEKALSHKYIRKIPNSKGGWNYIYPKDFAKPLKVLLSIFGLKEEKINDAYEKNNIQEAYGVDKKGFAAHLLEYLSNRATWNKFFNDKFNRDRFKTPEKNKSSDKINVKESEIKNNGKNTDKTNKDHNSTEEKDFKSKWNNTLMRKIYSMYNQIPEDKKVENPSGPVAFNVGDSVSYKGKVGKITKDFGNGMYFVNFENGGMGRLNAAELTNMKPTEQEVANEADVNAEKNNDSTLNTSNEVVAEPTDVYANEKARYLEIIATMSENEVRGLKEKFENSLANGDYNEYAAKKVQARIDALNEKLKVFDNPSNEISDKPGYSDVEKIVIALAYKKEKNFDPTLSDFAYYEKIKEKMPELAEKGELYPTMLEVKDMMLNERRFQAAKEYLENMKKDNDTKVAELQENTAKINDFQNNFNMQLSGDATSYLLRNMGVDTMAALTNHMNEFKEKLTPFTLNNLDATIEVWNEKIKKEKHPLVRMYRTVERDYFESLKNQESEQEEHQNRSEAMMGNQNAKKDKVKDKFKFEHKDYSLDELKVLRKDIQDNINMLPEDEYALPEDADILNAQLEAVDEMIATIDPSALSQANIGNQNAKNDGIPEDAVIMNPRTYDNAEDQKKYNDALKYHIDFVNHSDTDKGYLEDTIKEYETNPDFDNKPEIDALKDIYKEYIGEDYDSTHGNTISMLGNDNAKGLAENESNRRNVLNDYYDQVMQNDFEKYVTEEKLKLESDISRKRDKIKYLNSLNKTSDSKEDVINIAQNLEIFKLSKKWNNGANDSDVDKYIKNIALQMIKENAKVEAIKRTLSEVMKGNQNAVGKHNVKPKTEKENKEEKKEENKSRRKAGLKTPNEELGERSSAIEDVDVQNNEFTETEESSKEELKKEVKTPSNQAQKDAFNELAAARYELRKKEYGTSFYGKMNHKLVSTDEEVIAAQKRYDEALAKYNKLMGSDREDFSYNPNAENYAYRDTGYIAGSQKEKIAQFWADVQERGGGVKVEDIDWVALEENLRYAESKIIKSNILKKPDFEALRDSGMSGGAAYFYNRLIDCIPTKPAENTPEMHRQYVLAINTFQERMEKCKTVNEMVKEMDEIAEELSGVMVGVNTLPEVIEIQNQIDELRKLNKKEIEDLSHAKVDLWKIPLVKEFTENNTSFVRQAYGKPYPFAYPGLTSDKDSKLMTNFMTFLSNTDKWFTFIKENENELMKYPQFKAFKEIIDKSEIKENSRYYQNRNVILPTTKKINELEKEKKEVIQKKNDEYMATSLEYKMWAAFGDKYKGRFAEYMRSASQFNSFIYQGNKTILGHYDNARRGKFDDWEWLPKKEENSVSGEKKERKESFQLLVATEHERKGGKNVSVKTTQELKDMFNLRDIQSGEWVLSDPKSAKWHVDRCCEGFSDLCDVTGIPENLVSLNGRLALAIGARGHKGALAHYEPVERVINITKMHGGGSLAHEWFHSFDNMLSEAMLGGNIDAWLTKPGKAHYRDAPDNVIPEIKQAFGNLVDAMKKGDNPVMKPVKVTDTDKKNPDRVLRNILYYRNYGRVTEAYSSIMKATTFEEANKYLMDNFKGLVTSYNGTISSTKVKDFQKVQKAIAAKFGKTDVDVFTGETASDFFIESRKLDQGKDGYWSSLHEMAARAFSGFIGDNLRNAGRLNTYLTSHDTNDSYVLYGVKPNPEGEERERINKAFRELFDAVKSTGAIRKAIDILDNFIIEKSAEPRFIIKGGRFLIRK